MESNGVAHQIVTGLLILTEIKIYLLPPMSTFPVPVLHSYLQCYVRPISPFPLTSPPLPLSPFPPIHLPYFIPILHPHLPPLLPRCHPHLPPFLPVTLPPCLPTSTPPLSIVSLFISEIPSNFVL